MNSDVQSRRTLSKSDFKLARDCEMKLVWRENGLADNRASNAYLQLLADGGFMVEALARAMHPGGTLLDSGNMARDAEHTLELLRADNVTLYQATFRAGRRLVRTDILEKRGNVLRLIEVKAKSFDGAAHAESLQQGGPGIFRAKNKGHPVLADWLSKFEDLTYQVLVLEHALPGLIVRPSLLMVDKSKRSALDNVPSLFALVMRDPGDQSAGVLSAEFLGTANDLRQLDILTEVSASDEVALLRASVDAAASHYETLLDASPETLAPPLGPQCADCEFRTEPLTDSGFARCWGPLAGIVPHALGLFKISTVKDMDGTPLVTTLARGGKASLFDIPEARLAKKDGSIGPQAERQLRQIHHMRSGEQWVGTPLREKLERLTYPMHFIDFEVSRLALPYHANMRPYGQVVFQWSCHTVDAPGATPRHSEWLNSTQQWPNITFSQTLRDVIGERDTVMAWSPFEAGRLNELAREHTHFATYDPELVSWVEGLNTQRIFDLHKCALEDFYHPGMGGRTSIKIILDALWRADETLRAQYTAWTGTAVSAAQDPYKALPALEIAGVVQDVHEGTGAMRAYEAMLYGVARADARAIAQWRALLLQYCKLDTLSMVLVFEYWRRATGLAEQHV